MKQTILIALSLSVILLAGCAGGGGSRDAGYVDSSGPNTVVSLDQINIQDWSNAADQMVQSLLDSGVLQRAPRQPAIMVVSRIVNNTTQQVDTDNLTKKIRVALNKSGKVITTTTFGPASQVEDPIARQTGELERFQQGDTASMPIPYFSLSGKLLENRAQAGRTQQVTYTFQLSLTEISNGLAVWEDEVNITKQGQRNAVGW